MQWTPNSFGSIRYTGEGSSIGDLSKGEAVCREDADGKGDTGGKSGARGKKLGMGLDLDRRKSLNFCGHLRMRPDDVGGGRNSGVRSCWGAAGEAVCAVPSSSAQFYSAYRQQSCL